MQKYLDTCPGLVGDIARYIALGMRSEQPAICLAAAFSFVGALISKRVFYTSDAGATEPCLFCVVVADSGDGKTHAQNALRLIIDESGMNTTISGFLLGVPRSDSGMLKALANCPRRYLMWDEMGINLSAYAHTKASHEAMILGTAMKLYTQAGKPFIGAEYATQDRVDIAEPYLSIFGASTNNRWFSALNQDLIEDGFVPRLLLFFGAEDKKRRLPQVDPVMLRSIAERVRAIEIWHVAPGQGDLYDTCTDAMPRDKTPAIIEASTSANDVFNALDYWDIEIDEKSRDSQRGSITRLLYTRAMEQTIKICLCLADTTQQVPKCDAASTDYAIDLVRALINGACDECGQHIYRDQRTKEYSLLRDRFLNLLAVGESATKTQVYKRSRRWCDGATRTRIIDDLVESGDWYKETSPSYDSREKSITFQRVE